MFKRVVHLAPITLAGAAGFITDDMPRVGGGYLKPAVVEWINEDGTPYLNDVAADAMPASLGPCEPAELDPLPVIHRAVLPLENPYAKARLLHGLSRESLGGPGESRRAADGLCVDGGA
jgi:hypothetical protein